jgi:hypothetical protein
MNFNDHSSEDLLKSLEAEVAKTISEMRHAQEDLDKAQNRQKFILALVHYLKQRI